MSCLQECQMQRIAECGYNKPSLQLPYQLNNIMNRDGVQDSNAPRN